MIASKNEIYMVFKNSAPNVIPLVYSEQKSRLLEFKPH